MIHFSISNSSESLNGEHHYNHNQVTFSSTNAQLIIPSLKRGEIFSLEISPQGKLIISATMPFILNGQSQQDKAFIKKDELVEINDMKIKILGYASTPKKLFKDIVNEKLDTLIKDKDPIVQILKVIKG